MSEWLRPFQKPCKAPAPDAMAAQRPGNVSIAKQPLSLPHPSSHASLPAIRSDEYQLGTNDIVVPYRDAERSSAPDTGPLYHVRPSPDEMQDLWHRPTIKQIVDALYVIMMTKPVDAPLPVEYNVYVQRLLEGYASLAQDLRNSQELLYEEKQTKLRSIEEFTKMAKDWEKKEVDYKAEIRRMEVLLANSVPEGIEAVILARSGSIVDRSLAESRRFQARMSRTRREDNVDTEHDKSDFEKTVSSGCGSIVDSPKKSMQRSHRTILTMQRSVNHHADTDLSERLRSLYRRTKERRSTEASCLMSTDEESTDNLQGQDSEMDVRSPFEAHRALVTQKSTKPPAATRATGAVAETIERAPKRGHLRKFSFDPGEDELSLPKAYRPKAPDSEEHGLRALPQTGSSITVTCNASNTQTAAARTAMSIRTNSDTSHAERNPTMSGENKATPSYQDGFVSHDSASSKIAAIRDVSPNPTSDRRTNDALSNSNASPSCHGLTAGIGIVGLGSSPEGADCVEMEQARLLDMSIRQPGPLGEGQVAALAARWAMARGPLRNGPALRRRTTDTSNNDRYCP